VADTMEIKPPINSLGILVVLVVVILFSGFNNSFYTIEPEEVGVILRFGKVSRVTGPGLNFKFPFNIEKLYKVKTMRIAKAEFGFRTLSAGIRTQYQKKGYSDESRLLTGDLNVIDLEWIVQYKIEDPVKFLFNIRDVESSVRDVSEAVMRRVAGDRTFDEILTNRKEVAELAGTEIQKILNKYECGIRLSTVKLQDANPPENVKAAFNEVNAAIQEGERLKNEAKEIYNKVIPKAKGEARRTVEQSKGYALKRVNQAKGDVERFNAVFLEYKKAKEVTRKRLYLESMEGFLAKTKKTYIVDKGQNNLLPFVNFGDTERGDFKNRAVK